MCCGGDQAAALGPSTRWPAKSLVVAETAEDGRGTGCWRRSASTPPAMLAEAGQAGTGPAAARSDVPAARRAGTRSFCAGTRSRQLPRRARLVTVEGDEIGPRLARVLGGFWLARGFFQEDRDWLERALAGARPSRAAARRPAAAARRRCCTSRRPQARGDGLVGGSSRRRGGRRVRSPGADPGRCWQTWRSNRGGFRGALKECQSAAGTLKRRATSKGWPRHGSRPAGCVSCVMIGLPARRRSSVQWRLRGEALTTARDAGQAWLVVASGSCASQLTWRSAGRRNCLRRLAAS